MSSNPGVDAPYGNKDDDSEQKVCNAFHRVELSVQRSNYPPKPLKRQAGYLLRSSRYPQIYPRRCAAVSKGAARPCVNRASGYHNRPCWSGAARLVRPVPYRRLVRRAALAARRTVPSASFTAALVGKASAISGSSRTMFEPAAKRAAYLPRTKPPEVGTLVLATQFAAPG